MHVEGKKLKDCINLIEQLISTFNMVDNLNLNILNNRGNYGLNYKFFGSILIKVYNLQQFVQNYIQKIMSEIYIDTKVVTVGYCPTDAMKASG